MWKFYDIKLIKTNKVLEIKDLASLLNRHRNTISSWLEMYRKKGLHHNENLTNLQLLPTLIHETIIPHVGGTAYVKVIRDNPYLAPLYFSIFIK